MIKLMLRVLKKYAPILVLSFLFLLAQASAELSIPTIMGDIVNNGMLKGDTEYVYRKGAIMIALTVISAICSITASLIASKLAGSFGRDTREILFKKIEGYSLHEFDKIGTASLITRVTNDVTQIQNVLVMGFRFILYSPILMIGGFILALSKDSSLLGVLLVAMISEVIILAVLTKFVMPLFKSMQKKVDKLNLTLRESLTGIRVIRAFNKIDYDKAIFKKANDDLTDTSIKANRIMSIMQPAMMIVMNLTTVAVVWFGGLRVSTGNMELGDMISFMQYAITILMSIVMVAIMFVFIPRASASAERVNEALDMETEIIEPKVVKEGNEKKGYLEFKNVTFAYEGSDVPVIKNISFKSNPGEVTAIIGSTGSGKSTIANLIPRFYDVTSGEILIDDINIKDMMQIDLRNKIGFVPQGPILFSGTINENVRFGKEDATEEDIYKALEVAQATDFIENMPDGYETLIAQGGTNVSGGQKQRISIARAIVKKPEIYVFDDSFSALDAKTDSRLRHTLKKETVNSTLILIAQKISTIMDADRIIVLNNGNLEGVGTHEELLKSCKVYKEIALSQLSEEEMHV